MCARKICNATVLVALAALAGCATSDAPEFRGRWKPLNQFAETPQAIPLHQSYLYQASPIDNTVKGMLERWAKDSKLVLSYQLPNDYTLHEAASKVRSYSLAEAASMLSAAYASQHVSISLQGSLIVVRPAAAASGEAAAASSAD